MRRRSFLVGCGCLSLTLAAALRAEERSYLIPERFTRPDPSSEEGGLWAFMDREEQRLGASPFLIRDSALNQYVSDIACRLAGDHCPDMRVYLLRTPLFNASMAPNGMMQVWSGLLLRMTSEAQLAAVLGHEIGHYLARHSLERLQDAKSRSAFAQVLGVALTAAGAGNASPFAQLALLAGGLAYGRDHEREADRIGMELMMRAGYDPMEASNVWAQLLEELKGGKDGTEYWSESVLFATHPPAAERQETLAALAAARGQGRVGAEEYRRMLAPHRVTFLEDEMRRRRFGESMVLLERLQRASPQDGTVGFFKGELYRIRAQEGDATKALEAYRAAESMDAVPPELYRCMGLVLMQLRQDESAAQAFRRYLALRPAAVDAEMIRMYIPGEQQ